MFNQIEYFSNLGNIDQFRLLVVVFVLFVIFTQLVHVNFNTIIALVVVLVYLQYVKDAGTSASSNKNIFYSKMLDGIIKYVGREEMDEIALSEDTRVIVLLDTIKHNFTQGIINKPTFRNIVVSMNSFFKMKRILDIQVCEGVTAPDTLKNWGNETRFKIKCKCKRRVNNSKQVFEEAVKQGKLALNYTHSLIVNTQSQIEKHAIHDETSTKMKRLVYFHLEEMVGILKTQVSKQELDVIGTGFRVMNNVFDNSIENTFKFEL